MDRDGYINKEIMNSLQTNSYFVAILKHHGKITVPRSIFIPAIGVKQVWPNDFVTQNGSFMCITYDKENDEIGFELRYKSDGPEPENSLGFKCTRNQDKIGDVDYNSPLYRW